MGMVLLGSGRVLGSARVRARSSVEVDTRLVRRSLLVVGVECWRSWVLVGKASLEAAEGMAVEERGFVAEGVNIAPAAEDIAVAYGLVGCRCRCSSLCSTL